MKDEGQLEKIVMRAVETLRPDPKVVRMQITELKKKHPKFSKDQLANKYADTICWLYAGQGAATALPGLIPGMGTAAQIAVEGGAITGDLAYMLRCMAGMAMGVGYIYKRNMKAPFNQEFIRVLGLWCGVLTLTKEATLRIATKVAIAQFKRVPATIFKKINSKVATTIITKYGAKRGGIAVGRLIPFGVGMVVGGGFNLATMKGFKLAAISYYKSDEEAVTLEIK